MTNSKITFIVSAYNSSKFIKRLLDSFLFQTNHNFSIIICNDGSTDNTLEILNSYKKKFIEAKIDYLIINKENGGVSSAVNAMLPKIVTDYFDSCDSDDYFDNDFVAKFYELLNKNGDFDLAVSKARWVDEKGNILKERELTFTDNDDFIDIYLTCRRFPIYSGVHIYNTKSFIKFNNGTQIFDSRRGQNFQLIIPMVKHAKPVKFDSFYNYCIRETSWSHHSQSDDELYNSHFQFVKIYENVLSGKKYKKYLKRMKRNCGAQMRSIAWKNKNKKQFLQAFKIGRKSYKDYIKLFLIIFR